MCVWCACVCRDVLDGKDVRKLFAYMVRRRVLEDLRGSTYEEGCDGDAGAPSHY